MIIKIVTLFPKMFEGFLSESIIKRSILKGVVEFQIIDLREYSTNKHKKVDDTPYGGGAGMVLSCEVMYNCLKDIKTDKSHIVLLSPQGKTFNQEKAVSLSLVEELILVCGHYEGFDERIRSFVDEEISIGDYVLTGGEIPAMAISDSVVRKISGSITKESHEDDSFSSGLLEYPQYTRPKEFMGMEVPSVLQNGNHKEIAKFRKLESIRKTMLRRPDLIKNYSFDKEELKLLEIVKNELKES